MIGEIVPKITGILLLPIFTRYLSTEDYGVLSYTSSLMIFIYILSSLSLNSYVLRNYFEYKDEEKRKKMLGNIVTFIFTFNIIFAIVGGILLYFGFKLFGVKINFYPYVTLSLVSNFIEVFAIIPLVICRVQEKALKFISITIGQATISILLSLVYIIIFKMGLVGRYLGILSTNLIFFVVYITIIKQEVIININKEEVKKALQFSLPLLPGALSFALLDVSDRLILEKFVSLGDMGIYSIAYTLGFGVNVIINGGYRAFEPTLFKNINEENFIDIFNDIKKKYMFFVISFAMIFIFFSQELLALMTTEKFFVAQKIIPIIVITAIIKGLYVLYSVLVMAKNNTKLQSIAVIVGAFLSIVLNIIFIPKFGIVMAAISGTVGYLAMTLILHRNSYVEFNLVLKKEIKEYLILGILLFISYILFYRINISLNLPNFFIKIIIYISMLLLLKKLYRIKLKVLIQEFRHVK